MSDPEEVIEIDEEGRVHRPRDTRFDAGYKEGLADAARLCRTQAEWMKTTPLTDLQARALDDFAAELEALGQGEGEKS